MLYAIYKDGALLNTIVCEQEFIEQYCSENAYEYEALPDRPAADTFAPGPRQPTDLELAQREITDKDLDIIETAQALTDLELMMIGGTSHV